MLTWQEIVVNTLDGRNNLYIHLKRTECPKQLSSACFQRILPFFEHSFDNNAMVQNRGKYKNVDHVGSGQTDGENDPSAIPSIASILLIQWPTDFVFSSWLLLIFPFPTDSSKQLLILLLCLPISHFPFFHIHISKTSSLLSSSFLSVHVSTPCSSTFHTKHFTSLLHRSPSKRLHKSLLFRFAFNLAF